MWQRSHIITLRISGYGYVIGSLNVINVYTSSGGPQMFSYRYGYDMIIDVIIYIYIYIHLSFVGIPNHYAHIVTFICSRVLAPFSFLVPPNPHPPPYSLIEQVGATFHGPEVKRWLSQSPLTQDEL